MRHHYYQNFIKSRLPFGSPLVGRSFEVDEKLGYKFGFNGKEKDDEINVDGSSYDFGARILDTRLGRWFSVEPLAMKYPAYSTYCYSINNPILLKDVDGKDWTITVVNHDNGKRSVFIKIDAAVLNNSSNTKYTNDQLATMISEQLKGSIEQGIIDPDGTISTSIFVEANVRPINSVDKIKSNEHLFEIVNHDKIDDTPWDKTRTNGEAQSFDGKHILINERTLKSLMKDETGQAKNKKTIGHEMLHTGGLRHVFFWKSDQGKTRNPLTKTINVMDYGAEDYDTPTMTNKQVNTLIKNYNTGNLNKNDINKSDVKHRNDPPPDCDVTPTPGF